MLTRIAGHTSNGTMGQNEMMWSSKFDGLQISSLPVPEGNYEMRPRGGFGFHDYHSDS